MPSCEGQLRHLSLQKVGEEVPARKKEREIMKGRESRSDEAKVLALQESDIKIAIGKENSGNVFRHRIPISGCRERMLSGRQGRNRGGEQT